MIHENISRNDYVKLEGINASKLKPYYESSLNGNYEASKERKETDAMRFGTACHSAVLEPDKFKELYRVFEPPIYEKTGEPYRATTKKVIEYKKSLPTEYIYITMAEMDTITSIRHNIIDSKAESILDACPMRETAVTWTDDESGLECKALIDFMGQAIVGDFKTCRDIKYRSTEDATGKAIKWDLVSNGNLLQFAFYFDGLIANGVDVRKFAVIFAKNNGNNDVLPAFLSDESLHFGREMYNRAMLNYANRAENKSAFKLIEI